MIEYKSFLAEEIASLSHFKIVIISMSFPRLEITLL